MKIKKFFRNLFGWRRKNPRGKSVMIYLPNPSACLSVRDLNTNQRLFVFVIEHYLRSQIVFIPNRRSVRWKHLELYNVGWRHLTDMVHEPVPPGYPPDERFINGVAEQIVEFVTKNHQPCDA